MTERPVPRTDEWKAEIGSDAMVRRPDGSWISFGDAIYHPANVEEARAYAERMNHPEPIPDTPSLHEWTDAPDDEEGWLCTICGERRYPGDRNAHPKALPDTPSLREVGQPMPFDEYVRVADAIRQSGFDTGWHETAADFVTDLLGHLEPHGFTIAALASEKSV